MNRLLAIGAAAAVGVTLVGCGSRSRPQVDPDLAGKPTWAGCHARSIENIDHVSDARGKPTARAALAPYRSPGDHVVRKQGGELSDWLLVDSHGAIHTFVELEHGRAGWLVGTVEKCAR
jgi:hypothetical protein